MKDLIVGLLLGMILSSVLYLGWEIYLINHFLSILSTALH